MAGSMESMSGVACWLELALALSLPSRDREDIESDGLRVFLLATGWVRRHES